MTSFLMVQIAWFVRAGRVWQTELQEWRSRFFPIALTPKPATRDHWLGKNILEPVNYSDFLIKKQNSCQNQRRLTPRFGKIPRGNGLSWRFPPKKRRSRQNPRLAGGLGKFDLETVYHGDSPQKKRRLRQNRPPSIGLEKFEAEPVYHGDRETKRNRIGETIPIGEAIRIGKAAPPRAAPSSKIPNHLRSLRISKRTRHSGGL